MGNARKTDKCKGSTMKGNANNETEYQKMEILDLKRRDISRSHTDGTVRHEGKGRQDLETLRRVIHRES